MRSPLNTRSQTPAGPLSLAELRTAAAACGCTPRTLYRRQRQTRNAAAAERAGRQADIREIAAHSVGTRDISNWPQDFRDVADRDALRATISRRVDLTASEKAALLAAYPAVPHTATEGFVSRSQMLSQLSADHVAD